MTGITSTIGFKKSIGLGQFGQEKTSRIKSRINTDKDQTKDIKHNRHFIGDNCILIELLIIDISKNEES